MSWVGGRERIHQADERRVALVVGEDLREAPIEGVSEIQVIIDVRVAAGGDDISHVDGADRRLNSSKYERLMGPLNCRTATVKVGDMHDKLTPVCTCKLILLCTIHTPYLFHRTPYCSKQRPSLL